MSDDLKIQAACTRTGCSMFAGGICATCGTEVPAGYGEPSDDLKSGWLGRNIARASARVAEWKEEKMSDDLKKRLQYCSAYGTTARERIAATLGLSRIAELEAQLKAATEAAIKECIAAVDQYQPPEDWSDDEDMQNQGYYTAGEVHCAILDLLRALDPKPTATGETP